MGVVSFVNTDPSKYNYCKLLGINFLVGARGSQFSVMECFSIDCRKIVIKPIATVSWLVLV